MTALTSIGAGIVSGRCRRRIERRASGRVGRRRIGSAILGPGLTLAPLQVGAQGLRQTLVAVIALASDGGLRGSIGGHGAAPLAGSGATT
ncbi:hypothetical protein CCR80_00085 [Rhodothalassium salexigens]|nr:hypothetical protein [Rhodothalassium salexigens]